MCLRRAVAVEEGCFTAPVGTGDGEHGPPPQGTVRRFDPADRSGDLLLDDGTVLPFPGEAVDPVVRLLRPGQRVRLRLDGDAVVGVTLLTLGFSDE